MNRDIILKWIDEALKADPGEVVHLPVENKQHLKDLTKAFHKEIQVMAEISPAKASTLKLSRTMKDGFLWLQIEKISATPLVGFIKRRNGTTERINIGDPDRERRLKIMKEDGLTLEEIIDLEGDLTEDEAKFLKEE